MLARALRSGYEVLRREGSAAQVPEVEEVSAAPSARASAGLRRLGIGETPARAAAIEGALRALEAGRFLAPAAVVLTLPE